MYLIDTNVISEATTRLHSVDPVTIHLSDLAPGVISRGITVKQKSDPKAAASSVMKTRNKARASDR